ncbi:MAG: proline--tRNA ligase [Alphaproteobacteria bacterium]|nr:proline--tRNA ligase [Alphaproteobacteria bacterium]
MTKTAITPTREENFSEWYHNVITAADMAENSPTRGAITIKPYGYAIWELMRDELDRRIKAEGAENAYFPLLIPLEYMTKEASHVDGFAKECAVITHYRLKNVGGKIVPDPESALTEPYIIRPTSETIIGEAFSRWVNSYRDLPLKINQWANVMRWEMRTRPFIRTSEFLWQEGHCAFATPEEANADARRMHKVYENYMREFLAIEGVYGEKTVEERFAGADHTYSCEWIMQDGKGLQAGTSHDLGSHFAQAFGIKYDAQGGGQEFCHTSSWGVSTRMIGGLVMTHADDDGLVLPPNVAPWQVVIIPVGKDDADAELAAFCDSVSERLIAGGVRAMVDSSDIKPSDKLWKWVKKGVPLRVEIGRREMEVNSLTFVRRDLGKPSAKTIGADEFVSTAASILTLMQADILARAAARTASMIHTVADLKELDAAIAAGKIGFFKIKYDATLVPEYDAIEEKHKLTRRCLDGADDSFVYVAKAY